MIHVQKNIYQLLLESWQLDYMFNPFWDSDKLFYYAAIYWYAPPSDGGA